MWSWLNPDNIPEIVKNKWECIVIGKGKSYMKHPTVETFLQGTTTLDPPSAGKRSSVDLAGPSGQAPSKRGRKAGSTNQRSSDPANNAGGAHAADGLEAIPSYAPPP